MAKRRLWRAVAVGLAAAAVIYLAAGTWVVHQVIIGVLQVEPVDPARTSPGDPQAAFGLDFLDDPVETKLGPAPAWLILGPDSTWKGTWAIYVHGVNGRREDGYRYVKLLHEAGFPLLLMTYRNDEGAPQTADGLHGYGVSEWPDLEAAVSFATTRGATDVLLVGDSMGGAIVGQFLAQSDKATSVRAVIADSPALDFAERVNFTLGKTGFPFAPMMTALATQTVALTTGMPIEDAVAINPLAAFPGPLLLIHGTGDRVIPVSTSDRLLAKRVGVTTMLRTASDHLRTWGDHPDLFDATLRTFLDTVKTEAPR
jgi:hypothetical protein